MDPALMTEVSYLKGVGPQRAALLNERGIRTLEDLLACLPFRYEDRIRFSNIREIEPDKTYTVRAKVATGGAVRYARGRNVIYHRSEERRVGKERRSQGAQHPQT